MIYNGVEVKEFTSDNGIVFDPPKQMLVWDDDVFCIVNDPVPVHAYVPKRLLRVVAADGSWKHCAEIPEALKHRRATNIELMKWLAKGNGYCRSVMGDLIWTAHDIERESADRPCHKNFQIRKWEDADWHEPTVDYMGLEG